MSLAQKFKNHIKNIPGWRTKRKLVVFSVDDYGNVRLDSKAALITLKKAGIPFNARFDLLDTLETREDLEALYEVLGSVKDKHGNSAVFTPFALSCNSDFEAMADDGYSKYIYERLPKTYEKLSVKDPKAYSGTWELWQEGIDKGVMKPQFHGREHFNLPIFNDLLRKRDEEFLLALQERSYISVPAHDSYKNGWTAAYSFDHIKETEGFLDNVTDGLEAFKAVYGYESNTFTPPAQEFPLHLEPELKNLGIDYIDRPRHLNRHLGDGNHKVEKHALGEGDIMTGLVRNVVFEPNTKQSSNWVDFSFKQVEAAFRLNKPANISSHRVNFCGHIDEDNRKEGLTALKQLLEKIVKRWPEVEFISADQLGELITQDRK